MKRSSLLLISGVLLLLIFALTTDLGEMWLTLHRANYLVLLPGIIAYFIGVWFRTLRWQVLLQGIKIINARTLFPIVIIGYMANNILPFRLGELVRGYYLKNKEEVSTATALSTIFIERIMDGLALIVILLVSSVFVPFHEIFSRLSDMTKINPAILVAIFTLPFAMLFLLLTAIALNTQKALGVFTKCTSRLPKSLESKVNQFTEDIIEGLNSLTNWKITIKALLLSLPIWILEAVLFHSVLISLNIIPSGTSALQVFSSAASITAITNIGASIPSLPGGIGLFELMARESLMVIETMRVSRSEAAAFAALTHLCLILPIVLLGQLFLWNDGLSIRKIQRQI